MIKNDVLDIKNTIYSEEFKKIRTNLKYTSTKSNRTILITSSEAGEGKSTIALNLASSLAEDNKKVVLVDCDLRRPSLHKYLKISNNSGVSDILVGKKSLLSCIRKVNDNFSIITAGYKSLNPMELLDTEEMDNLIKELKNKFDYVIIDSPPITVVSDAQILASKVDGIIVVVKAEQTKKDKLNLCRKLITNVNGNIIGGILNDVATKAKFDEYY